MADEKPKKDQNPEQDNLFREIDEELRDERMTALWNAYGKYLIGAAVAIVVIVAGYKGWQGYDLSTRTAAGDSFLAAADKAAKGENEAALQAFAQLSSDAPAGYALLARLREAALLGQNGDTAGAVAAYGEISGDSGIAQVYRDLARVLAAQIDLDRGNAQQAATAVSGLTADDNPWRFSAREVTALAALAAGDKAQAKTLFDGLAADAQTPIALKQRASDFAQMLATAN